MNEKPIPRAQENAEELTRQRDEYKEAFAALEDKETALKLKVQKLSEGMAKAGCIFRTYLNTLETREWFKDYPEFDPRNERL